MANRRFECSAEALARLEVQLGGLAAERLASLDHIESTSGDSINPDENIAKEQARRELELLDARIEQVKDMVAGAVVVDAAGSESVMVGSTVTLAFDGDPADTEVFLVGHLVESVAGVSVASPDSPLGAVLWGATVGESLSWSAPSGVTMQADLVAVA